MILCRNLLFLLLVPATKCWAFSGYLSSITTHQIPDVVIDQTKINNNEKSATEINLCNAAEKFMKEQGRYFSSPPSASENNDDTSILADDFVFRGPVIGPLNKHDYLEVLDYFKIYEAFPDVRPNCFGFTTDPNDPLKVRFFVKATGTYQNRVGGLLGKCADAPDGREYKGSTEAWSITFTNDDNDDNDNNNTESRMQVKCVSAGYVVDRFEDKSTCTTGGKGLSFGVFQTAGVPFPVKPGSKRLRLIQWLTNKFAKGPNAKFPKAFSDPKTIPEWWTDSRLGAE